MTTLPVTTPAAVNQGDGTMAVEEMALPALGPDDVLLEVHYCGVCGSDLHLILEKWSAAGYVGGHEYSGTVVAVGDNVRAWSVGDLVVGGPDPGCGTCALCRAGRTQLCLHKDMAGVTPARYPGAFARYKPVASSQILRVPAGVDARTAALAEPLAVAVHAVRNGGAAPGHRVLVTGAGPIGLLSIAVLREMGIDQIVVSEPGAERRQLAMRVGATESVTPDQLVEPLLPMEVVAHPFDVAYECAGRADAIEAALGQLGRNGTLVIVGAGMKRPRLDPNRILLNELHVTGACEYTREDFDTSFGLLASGRFPTDLLVEADDVPLVRIQWAFEQLASGRLPGKVMVVP